MAAIKQQQLGRGDRLMFSSSDDNVMMKQIEATHVPDGRDFDVRPLLYIVEDIFSRAAPSLDAATVVSKTQAQKEALEDKTLEGSIDGVLDKLSYNINRISSEITCKCSGSSDAHATTVTVLNMVSNFSWDAKLVIALAALSVNYGEFWLVAQNCTSNQLAKSVAILRQLPEIFEHANMLKPRFDAIKTLIKAMLDVARCIVQFKELPTEYITEDVSALSMAQAHIPIGVYWTIRSVVACASQIFSLTGFRQEHMVGTTEAWELSSLAHKVNSIYSHLAAQLAACNRNIDEKKYIRAYQDLLTLFQTAHIDNMRVLRALIYAKDDLQPLVDGTTKRRVNIDVLRRKNVLLLISDLDISNEEISILEQIYNESRLNPSKLDSQFELVWLPIIDPAVVWTESKQKQFESLQSSMPWHTVHHPSLIDRAVIKFIKEEWKFSKKPILVVLDPQGRIACPNALHMMWIWGTMAFPFTTSREQALWKEESWKLELLVDGIDPTVLNWMNEGRYICLYGGEDIDWIRKFTTTAQGVAKAAEIPLGMVYVGKSNPKERVRRNAVTIMAEKLSHYWQDLAMIWYFWVRIESMWNSKMQLGSTAENDPIMKEIMTMLSFDGSDGGWAVWSKGSSQEITRAKGSLFLTALIEYNTWKEQAQQEGFMPALKDHLKQLHTPHHCNRLLLPGSAGTIPEKVVCAECGRTMEKFIMYKCCDE